MAMRASRAVSASPQTVEVLFILHHPAQTLAHDGMVVDDQYPPHLALAIAGSRMGDAGERAQVLLAAINVHS